MRIFAAIFLVALLPHISKAQDSISWELKVDLVAPMTNNVTFGLEGRGQAFGVQVDIGFPVKIINYDNLTGPPSELEDEYSGVFYKVSGRFYNALNKEKRYLIAQYSRSMFSNEDENIESYGFFAGIGERHTFSDRFNIDFYLAIGIGSSTGTVNDHYGYYKFNDSSFMISIGVNLGFHLIKI